MLELLGVLVTGYVRASDMLQNYRKADVGAAPHNLEPVYDENSAADQLEACFGDCPGHMVPKLQMRGDCVNQTSPVFGKGPFG